jgi:hypothetical protein
MMRLIALALLAASAPAAAQKVVASDADWSYLPQMPRTAQHHLTPEAITSIHAEIIAGNCTLPGQSDRELDMSVPFAARFDESGKVEQLVIRKLGCPRIEGIIAGALLEMIGAQEYKPTGKNPDGWYRGVVSFGSRV